jgi:hypothetical protein
MYWKYGEISKLAALCDLRPQYVHDVIKGRRKPRIERAELLEERAQELGKYIPAEEWLDTKESNHEAFRGD